MAKSRRNTRRRANRKSRRANTSRGLVSRLYSPVSHVLQAANNVVGSVTGTVRNVAGRGIRGVNSIGKSVTGHTNAAVRNLIGRKRKSRRAGRR